MIDLKNIKLYGLNNNPEQPKIINLEKLKEGPNSQQMGDPEKNKIDELKQLVEDVKKKETKKQILVGRLNEIISKYYKDDHYF